MQIIVQSLHLAGCHFNITFQVPAILAVAVFPMNKSSSYSAGVYIAKASFAEQICLEAPESRNHSLGFPTKLHSESLHTSHLHLPSFPQCLLDFYLYLCLCLCPFRPMTSLTTMVTFAFEFLLGMFWLHPLEFFLFLSLLGVSSTILTQIIF